MSKKILLIESDSAFARSLADALEPVGVETRTVDDGKEGLDLARDWVPDAIVLCVELPGMSGYVICQKLKKDDALKGIPLVLTSSEATTETFAKHQQLKVRADEYLLKPFAPESLLEKLQALVGLPDGATAVGVDEEVVSLEEETDLEALAAETPGDLPALDLQSLPDEPGPGGVAPSGDDEDLRLLDDAFEGLAQPAPSTALDAASERRGTLDEPDAAAASLSEPDDEPAREDLSRLTEETDGVVGLDEASEARPAHAAPRGPSADALRAAGIKLLDDRASTPPAAPDGPAASARELKRLERALAERDDEVRRLGERLEAAERRAEALAAQLEETEADLRTGRDEGRHAEDLARRAKDEADSEREAADELRRRVAELEEEAHRSAAEATDARQASGRVEALEREVDELKTELVVARGEVEGAREEVEKRTGELMRQVQELEAGGSKNEERMVKAYQKLKADEKVREKVRKALAIAMQLLDHVPPGDARPEEEREAPPLAGRE